MPINELKQINIKTYYKCSMILMNIYCGIILSYNVFLAVLFRIVYLRYFYLIFVHIFAYRLFYVVLHAVYRHLISVSVYLLE